MTKLSEVTKLIPTIECTRQKSLEWVPPIKERVKESQALFLNFGHFLKIPPEDQEFIFFDESKLSFERNQFLRKLKKKKRKRTLQPTSTNASSFYGGCSAARDRTGLGSSSKARA